MKTTLIYSFLSLFISTALLAQDRTTVTATSYDVSDNLDLKAVASIFGESRNLEDFEQRLNDPSLQISNLDLNNDNEVDYIRVIEATQDNTRLVVLQAVLGRDVYQDVATIEVEKRGNDVQVQVVGDVYMYGPNYIYEPVYVARPVFFDFWWSVGYRPYVSTWYWGYYPRYWHVWHPMPVYRYRDHVHVHINVHNHYNYVNVRGSRTAARLYSTRRQDSYARRYPERAFAQRHANVSNRYELDKTRKIGRSSEATRTRSARSEAVKTRNAATVRNTRSNDATAATRDYPTRSNPRGGREGATATRDQSTIRNREATSGNTRSTPRVETRGNRSEPATRATAPRTVNRDNQPTRAQRSETPRAERSQPRIERQSAPRVERQQAPRMERQQAPRVQRQQAPQQPRGDGGNRGGGRGRD